MAIPEYKCWDACESMIGSAVKPGEDRTDWPAIITVTAGDAGGAARHYLLAKLDGLADIRRARSLLKLIRQAPEVASSCAHPFVIGHAKTASGADYGMMLWARAAEVHWTEAKAAAAAAVAGSKLRGRQVLKQLYAAGACVDKAGAWPYDASLCPVALRPGFIQAVDTAFVAGLVQQGLSECPEASVTYSATELLAGLLEHVPGSAARHVQTWAAREAMQLRLGAAARLVDPRPPASAMLATDAQLLMELHTGLLPPPVQSRLSLGVALNGYMGSSATELERRKLATKPTLVELRADVLAPSKNGLAAVHSEECFRCDCIAPYRDALGIRFR